MFVLGFAGLAYSGKTTVARYVVDRLRSLYSIEAHSLHFASPIKDALRVAGIAKDLHPKLFRQTAQALGQAARDENPDWWVGLTRRRVETILDNDPDAVIVFDDVRYVNEVDFIESFECGRVVFVDRPSGLDLDDPIYSHDSEALAVAHHKALRGGQPLPRLSLTLSNSGSKHVLFDRVAQTLDDFIFSTADCCSRR